MILLSHGVLAIASLIAFFRFRSELLLWMKASGSRVPLPLGLISSSWMIQMAIVITLTVVQFRYVERKVTY